jgi:broad specificity phosphatase PhoE
MSTIFFIRHGQASFGKEDYDELSEIGQRQSELLARYFVEMNRRFDVIYTGTLERHRQTADALVSFMKEKTTNVPEIHRLEGLNEYPTQQIFPALAPFAIRENPSLAFDVGRLMTDRRSFQKVFEALMSLWASGRVDVPKLLTWKDFTGRVNAAIDEIMQADGTGKNIAVFTSGGAISVAVARTLHLSNDDTMRVAEQLVNTSVSRFKCTRERIMLFSCNEYPHLEREKDEQLITYR